MASMAPQMAPVGGQPDALQVLTAALRAAMAGDPAAAVQPAPDGALPKSAPPAPPWSAVAAPAASAPVAMGATGVPGVFVDTASGAVPGAAADPGPAAATAPEATAAPSKESQKRWRARPDWDKQRSPYARCNVRRKVCFVFRTSSIRTSTCKHCRNRSCARNGGKDTGTEKAGCMKTYALTCLICRP